MEGVKIAALAFKNDPIFPLFFKVFTRSHSYTQIHTHIITTKLASRMLVVLSVRCPGSVGGDACEVVLEVTTYSGVPIAVCL